MNSTLDSKLFCRTFWNCKYWPYLIFTLIHIHKCIFLHTVHVIFRIPAFQFEKSCFYPRILRSIFESYLYIYLVIVGQTSKHRPIIEPVCCKKRQKSPNQETGFDNRGHLKLLNDTKLVLNEHE